MIGAMKEFTRKREYKRDHPSIIKRLSRSVIKGIQKIPDKVRKKMQEIGR